MNYALYAKVSHEVLSDLAIENSGNIRLSTPYPGSKGKRPGVNLQFTGYTDDEIFSLAARLEAKISRSDAGSTHLVVVAVRPDAQNDFMDIDLAGFWGGK